MKKVWMFVCLFVCLFVYSGCGDDGPKNVTGGSGLPSGWRATWETSLKPTNPQLFWYTWHVGVEILFYTEIIDKNNQVVSSYDTSATTWEIVEGSATISHNSGPSTYIKPTSTGTFKLRWEFKGTHTIQPFTVV